MWDNHDGVKPNNTGAATILDHPHLVLTVHSCRVHLARVTQDEAVRVWLSTLSLWSLNPPGNEDKKTKTIQSPRRQPGETRDPLTRTSQTAKKARANEMRHERPRLYESIRSKVSVSIYILALTLSQVLSARVYSRHSCETTCFIDRYLNRECTCALFY